MSKTVMYPEFDRVINVRDAYRAMEHFLAAYLSRGDTSVSDFLHAYAGVTVDGRTTDPAAAEDFLASVAAVVDESTP